MDADWPDYELLDFGDGRKLERVGDLVVDRPAPAAARARAVDPESWTRANWRFSGDRMGDGSWKLTQQATASTNIVCTLSKGASFMLAVEPSPAGQIGLFPEQFANWQWLAAQAQQAPQPPRVINLFGYTGASTLALAAAGAKVTHVDASRPSVAQARANAKLSGLSSAPVRWIVEDALRYVEREVKRGQVYDGVVLDPPTYGHGPAGQAWRLERDLPKLLRLCKQLTADAPRLVLLTCHTPGVAAAELSAYLSDGMFGHCWQPPHSGTMFLATRDGRRLASGHFARWPR